MLQTFLPLFAMTFMICLFIVLMQFLWRYVDEFVGKGLDISVMAELFFYAALTFVPMALPLAILLASLMTFGNLGESLELLAMKASGISLLKIMRPLILLMVLLAAGAFFFQDRVLPMAQVKMYSILLGIKQKSPELEIPEGVFYKEINDYNIYVGKKNHKTGLLQDVTIYIFDGTSIEDATVTVADSARISMSPEGQYLKLTLWNGEQVGTFKQGRRNDPKHPKYRRESFAVKEVFIPYSNDFEKTDESVISNHSVGKNLEELTTSIDSIGERIDSVNLVYGRQLVRTYFREIRDEVRNDSTYFASVSAAPINLDSIYASMRPAQMEQIANRAKSHSQGVVQSFTIRTDMQEQERKTLSLHYIEIHKKFTLSMGCLLFFLIGAPLGAIIRKGGLGVPVIVSVLFFIIYFVIDNTGQKMAKNGEVDAWFGVWLSSIVLAPVGIFLTWRAINDSTLFDWDSYRILFTNLSKRWLVWGRKFGLIREHIRDRRIFTRHKILGKKNQSNPFRPSNPFRRNK